jgi:hypothetical protein
VKVQMIVAAAATVVLPAAHVAAQQSVCLVQGPGSACEEAFQALASGAPQFGIAAAGGNPVPGVEGTRGVTLGLIPKTSASLRVSAARVRLPNLDVAMTERTLTPVAFKLATATRLFEGGATGLGALDLLLEAGAFTGTGDGGRTAAVLGGGARIGVLRETFGAPGVALSGMVRHVGPIRYGKRCVGLPADCSGLDGEAAFGVDDFSARLTVGKRVGPVGLLGGAGWDRFSTTHGVIGYRGIGGIEPTNVTVDADAHDSRWSAFANLSYGLPLGSLVAEGGWMSGGSAVDGYSPGSSGYDPGQGTFFGSIALRVQL